MMKPYNPYFFPVLCCAAFANLVVNALDDGKTETVPADRQGAWPHRAADRTRPRRRGD